MVVNQQSEFRSELSTTSSLINDLKGYSPERWNRFVLVYSPLLLYWIRKKSIVHPADEDILQDCMASIVQGISQFERGVSSGSFRGWLRTIVNRRVADHLRSLSPETSYESDWFDKNMSADAGSESDLEGEQKAIQELEARALVLLQKSTTEKTWQIFRMSVLENVPTAEVAKAFGVTPSAVRLARGRVLQRLRELMLDRLTDPD